ncbi:MAG: 5'-nucleotidase C-terminal domain-containing protein [Myxococcota bacterium]
MRTSAIDIEAMRRIACMMSVAVWFSACAGAHPATGSRHTPRCVTLLAANDVHGSLEPQRRHAGDVSVTVGGLLTMSGYINAIRARSRHAVVLLDAGDIYQGTLVSNRFWGRSVIDVYNAMEFDAAVLGNHEFDFGDGERKDGDLLGVVRDRVAQARFPFLTLNVRDRNRQTMIDWPNTRRSMLIERGAVKVGVIGVSTPQTPNTTRRENVASLDFALPPSMVAAEAQALRDQGAELVVLLGHLGGACRDLSDPHDTSSCEQDSELFELIRALPHKSVDVAIGGHTHQYIAHWYQGVAVLEAGASAQSLSRVDACIDPTGGIDVVTSKIHRPIALCAQQWQEGGCEPRVTSKGSTPAAYAGIPIAADPAVEAAAAPYLAEIEELQNTPLGVELPYPLKRDGLLDRNIGALVAEGLARTVPSGLAIQNRGGVRSDLKQGVVTFGDAFEVSPFDNHVAHLRLKPAQIERLIELLYRRRSQIPYISGLAVETDGDRIKVRRSDGQPWIEEQRYPVATNDYIAFGGDGFDARMAGEGTDRYRIVLDITVRDAWIRVLRERFGSAPQPAGAERR